MFRPLESVTNDQLAQNIQQRKASYTGRILHIRVEKCQKGTAPVYPTDQYKFLKMVAL